MYGEVGDGTKGGGKEENKEGKRVGKRKGQRRDMEERGRGWARRICGKQILGR